MLIQRNIKQVIYLVTCLCAIVFCVYSFIKSGNNTLFDNKVMDCSTQQLTGYAWMSDSHLLYWIDRDTRTDFYDCDLRHHSSRRMDHLSNLFSKTVGNVQSVLLSPDSKRVLWLGNSGKVYSGWLKGDDWVQTNSFSLQRWTHIARAWTSDSKSWAEFLLDWNGMVTKGVILHTLDGTKRTVQYPAYSTDATYLIPTTITASNNIVSDAFAHTFSVAAASRNILDADVLFLNSSKIENQLRLSLRSLDNPAVLHNLVIPFPPGRTCIDRIYSPDGMTIAFLMQAATDSPLDAIFFHLFNKHITRKNISYQLWVCRIDGKNMHSIGDYSDNSISPVELSGLTWLPDSKHLSFIYKKSLYVIPVKNF